MKLKKLNRLALLGAGILSLGATVGCGTGVAPSATSDPQVVAESLVELTTIYQIIESGRSLQVTAQYMWLKDSSKDHKEYFQNNAEAEIGELDHDQPLCLAGWDSTLMRSSTEPATMKKGGIMLGFYINTPNSFIACNDKTVTLQDLQTAMGHYLSITLE